MRVWLGASELAPALAFHPHVDPWVSLRRLLTQVSKEPSSAERGEEGGPGTSVARDAWWWHPTQIDLRKKSADFPFEDPLFAAAVDYARETRESPAEAIRRLEELLKDCSDREASRALVEGMRQDLACRFGKKAEREVARAFLQGRGLKQDETIRGDALGDPVRFEIPLKTVRYRGCDGEGGTEDASVSVVLFGLPDLIVSRPTEKLVCEIKCRSSAGPMPRVPIYDQVQCWAYGMLRPDHQVLLLERHSSSAFEASQFLLVVSETTALSRADEWHRRIHRRLQNLGSLLCCCRFRAGFLSKLENLQPAVREEWLRSRLSQNDP